MRTFHKIVRRNVYLWYSQEFHTKFHRSIVIGLIYNDLDDHFKKHILQTQIYLVTKANINFDIDQRRKFKKRRK